MDKDKILITNCPKCDEPYSVSDYPDHSLYVCYKCGNSEYKYKTTGDSNDKE